MDENFVHISISAGKQCYATLWSYGEICVGSNCCGRMDLDRGKIIAARIHYHKEMLAYWQIFDQWSDDTKLKGIQERNVKANIRYNKAAIARLESGKMTRPAPKLERRKASKTKP